MHTTNKKTCPFFLCTFLNKYQHFFTDKALVSSWVDRKGTNFETTDYSLANHLRNTEDCSLQSERVVWDANVDER